MTIFRGPGGGGNATSDSEVNLLTALSNESLAYAEQAALEAGLAAVSAAAASGSAFDANASAVAALASETEAALSESAAAISASNALASENASAISASTATTGASTATAQAGLSAASAAAALVSEGNAATSASAASTSASTASTQASNAASSASAASTSATNAASSATAASGSASTASTQATNASNSASAASTSASNAATSETNAANSASAAAASAASINDANLVHKTGDETVGGIKTFSSDIIGNLTGSAATVSDGAITYAKMQSVTAGKLLGRNTSGSGVVQELPIAVTASGNVGIGALAPAHKLGLVGSLDTRVVSLYTGGGNNNYSGIGAQFSSASAFCSSEVRFGNENTGAGTGFLSFATGTNTTTERLRISGTGQRSSTVPGGATLYPDFACRAWVSFNGTGTVAIRASGNVSSITDNGVGDYTVNFSTAMPDDSYCVGSFSGPNRFYSLQANTQSVSGVRVNNRIGDTGGAIDSSSEYSSIQVFR